MRANDPVPGARVRYTEPTVRTGVISIGFAHLVSGVVTRLAIRVSNKHKLVKLHESPHSAGNKCRVAPPRLPARSRADGALPRHRVLSRRLCCCSAILVCAAARPRACTASRICYTPRRSCMRRCYSTSWIISTVRLNHMLAPLRTCRVDTSPPGTARSLFP